MSHGRATFPRTTAVYVMEAVFLVERKQEGNNKRKRLHEDRRQVWMARMFRRCTFHLPLSWYERAEGLSVKGEKISLAVFNSSSFKYYTRLTPYPRSGLESCIPGEASGFREGGTKPPLWDTFYRHWLFSSTTFSLPSLPKETSSFHPRHSLPYLVVASSFRQLSHTKNTYKLKRDRLSLDWTFSFLISSRLLWWFNHDEEKEKRKCTTGWEEKKGLPKIHCKRRWIFLCFLVFCSVLSHCLLPWTSMQASQKTR